MNTCEHALPILRKGAQTLGINLSDSQAAQFAHYCNVVLTENRKFNLTAHRTPEAIMRGLILESLALDASLPASVHQTASLRIIDVGSGAGIPGIPLKILHPGWDLALVESIGKKARFLENTAETMGLTNVSVLNRRAEELGASREWRDRAQLVVARAVALLTTLLELCAPLAAPGGLLAFPKGIGAVEEIGHATFAARVLRMEVLETRSVPSELAIGDEKVIVMYRKTAETPPGYPRRIGLARTRPIGFTG